MKGVRNHEAPAPTTEIRTKCVVFTWYIFLNMLMKEAQTRLNR